ncbi:MAG: GYF domain-containing protein [Planctomycetaceae bacterium]
MATDWYYAIDGRQYGPVPPRELKNLAERGDISGGDLVWKEGMPDWMPASQIQGLSTFPSPPPPPPSAPFVNVDEAPGTYSTTRRRLHTSRSMVGPMILIVAALPMIACLFVPWWSFRLNADEEQDAEQLKGKWANVAAQQMSGSEREIGDRLKELEKTRERLRNATTASTTAQRETQRNLRDRVSFLRVAKRSKKWWDRHLESGGDDFDTRLDELAENVDKDEKLSMSMTVWGWNAGSGIMAFVFGAAVLVLGIVSLAVPILRIWSWTVSAAATVMGILALVFSMLWVFQAPSRDVGSLLEQGVVVGPWLLLGAGAVFFVVGLFDTIFGISFIARRVR